MKDPYYSRPEVSNSDLSWLKNQLFPRDVPDPTKAYAFGSLIDAIITEPEGVDYYNHTLNDYQYTKEDFETAIQMKQAFFKDPLCRQIAENATGQQIMIERKAFNYEGFDFNLNTRCKWDFWMKVWGWGADLKSTVAETQSQFEDACRFFDYDRQRAFYMNIADSPRDMLIGISKKNFKVFKLPITRDCSFYKDGFNKMNELSFRHYTMFGEWKHEENPKPEKMDLSEMKRHVCNLCGHELQEVGEIRDYFICDKCGSKVYADGSCSYDGTESGIEQTKDNIRFYNSRYSDRAEYDRHYHKN